MPRGRGKDRRAEGGAWADMREPDYTGGLRYQPVVKCGRLLTTACTQPYTRGVAPKRRLRPWRVPWREAETPSVGFVGRRCDIPIHPGSSRPTCPAVGAFATTTRSQSWELNVVDEDRVRIMSNAVADGRTT